jgi:hypothetical protein
MNWYGSIIVNLGKKVTCVSLKFGAIEGCVAQ